MENLKELLLLQELKTELLARVLEAYASAPPEEAAASADEVGDLIRELCK